MDAAVVELDALPDAVRPRSEDHDARTVTSADLVLGTAGARPLPARVVVRRPRRKLGRARVDGLERPLAGERRLGVGGEVGELVQEPRVDARTAVQLVDRDAAAERLEQLVEPLGARLLDHREQLGLILGEGRIDVELARAHCLGERLPERPPDRHHLPDRLHVGRQPRLRAWELLEREPRPFDDAVVDRGLEARRCRLRDVVGNLLERVADGEPSRDLGDRKPRRLAGESARTGHPGVHLDHHDLVRLRVHGELDVGAAGLDPDRADHRDRLVAELLVLLVGERLLRRHADAVAGVHAHRIEVLDRAHDHHVVGVIAHHLELELAPSEDRFLEEYLADRRRGQPAPDDAREVRLVANDTPAATAERERGPHDQRQADVRNRGLGVGDTVRDRTARDPQAGGGHRLPESLAVLSAVDRLVVGANQLDAVLAERPVLVQRLGQVQGGLAAQRRQNGVGLLARDHLGDRPGQERLDVRPGRDLGVGHDRRGVGVHEHDLVALLHQHLARLGAGVVELGRLTDDDRPGADQQDPVDVVPTRHLVNSRPHHGAPAGRPLKICRRGTASRAVRAPPRGGTGRWRRARRGA